MDKIILCSECFNDTGLKLISQKIGLNSDEFCPNCYKTHGYKLNKENLEELAYIFFVNGSVHKVEYGEAPIIQFNKYHYKKSNITTSDWLKNDLELIEKNLKIGFFHYGPRLWMVGEIEPLKDFLEEKTKKQIIKQIIKKYPDRKLKKNETFYRLRINPNNPKDIKEYDSPPEEYCGRGRLDSPELPIMYGSQDLEVCIHECRVSVEDNVYVSTLALNKDIKLLDLTSTIKEDKSEFESLDLSVYMLFSAGSHTYNHLRKLAIEIYMKGYDGVIYPSYFSSIKTGGSSGVVPNIALFDRPLKNELVSVKCINKLLLKQIKYDMYFGPIEF